MWKKLKILTTVRKVRGWYEKSVVQTVRKVQGRYEKVHGTNRPWCEKSTNGTKRLWYEKSGSGILWDHAVLYFHPTQVNSPRLNPIHTGGYSIYLPRRDGRLSWPTCMWLVIYRGVCLWLEKFTAIKLIMGHTFWILTHCLCYPFNSVYYSYWGSIITGSNTYPHWA